MIFYGRKASRLKDGQLRNVTCPSCDTNSTMTYSIFGKYAHIYWIPTFPMGKENIIECDNCKQTFKVKELPEQIKNKFKLENQDVKTPFWNFTGLAIIACLIMSVIYISKQDGIDSLEYIKAPKSGDVYTIKGSEDDFISTMKVIKVKQDSVVVVYNEYESDGYSISKLNKLENYNMSEAYSFSKEEIQNMFDTKDISAVKRD